MSEPLLTIRDLVTEFSTPDGTVRAVDHVSFDVGVGETIAVVGESGSGKSVTAMSVLGLLPPRIAKVVKGEARLEGRDLLAMSPKERSRLLGADLAMIFQDPLTSLNPVLRVGRQITEVIRTHREVSKKEARERAVELLRSVGVGNAERRMDQYPHEFSGGMRQRVMIAMAIANSPKLLIADEPTTALDVTVQAQVLDVLEAARRQTGASTILITHDLGLVAEAADRVVVMYGGRVLETGPVHQIFHEPRHPYTRGLLQSLPGLDRETEQLVSIGGTPPSLLHPPSGCVFHPRCQVMRGREVCSRQEPALLATDEANPARTSRCHFHEELAAGQTRREREEA